MESGPKGRTKINPRGSSLNHAAEHVAAEIRGWIDRGDLNPGDKIASFRDLMKQSGQSFRVVKRAMELLVAEDLVEHRKGAGTFVRESARELGRTEAANGEKRIGVVPPVWPSSPSRHYVVGAIFHGISEQASYSHHRVELFHFNNVDNRSLDAGARILDRGFDGVIWIQPDVEMPMSLVKVGLSGIPMVTTGRRFRQMPIPHVDMDMDAFGALIAEQMLERDLQKLMCLVGLKDDLFMSDRVDAIRRGLDAAGLSLADDYVFSNYISRLDKKLYSVDWHAQSLDYLKNHLDFDAVFSMYPEHLGPLMELHYSGVKECPRDYHLFHFGQSVREARDLLPDIPMIIVDPPLEAIGRQAVRELEKLWGETPATDDERLLPVIRESSQYRFSYSATS